MVRKGFGRGIQSLLGDNSKDKDDNSIIFEVSTESVLTNPYQPRKVFNDEEIKELSESIKNNGLLQPIIVRRAGSKYELIAGERRLRAVKLSGMENIPVRILDIDDNKMLELSIIENVQREDLNAVDEALAYKRLVSEFNRKHDEISDIVGKSRSYISNILRILSLPEDIQDLIKEKKLTLSHARTLLAYDDENKLREAAKNIIENNISVRDLENITKSKRKYSKNKKIDTVKKDPNTIYLEEEIMKIFGTGVRIIKKQNKGTIEIDYYSDDDLDRIISMIRTL